TTRGQAVELEATAEACRDAHGVAPFENTLRDIRHAARSLRHTPGFTIPVLLTLALGLGAAIAIFSVANAVLLQPLAYPASSQLVELRESIPLAGKAPIPFSAPDIAQVRTAGSVFASVGSFEENERDLATGSGPARRVYTARVSANLFPMLGAAPLLGHNFTPRQDTPGHNVALLSYALWRSQLGGNPGIIGRTVHLDGALYTVAGVMPPQFEFPPRGLTNARPADIFVPMAFTSAELTDLADNFDIGVLARLRPGATLSQARAQMAVASQHILQTWKSHLGAVPGLTLRVTVDSLRSLVIGPARVLMDLLLGAAALLLLLSCANTANLFLVRASTRQREWSLRAALGASGGRLIRQALTESTLLSLAAAAAGLLLAWCALHLLTAAAPTTLPQVRAIGLDGSAFAFALIVALIIGPLCGLLPALSAAHSDLERSLREDAPSLAGARSGVRTRQALVVAQVAIAFVLVCGAGLLIRSFLHAESGSGGVDAQGVTTASLLLPKAQYSRAGAAFAFWRSANRQLSSRPGVVAVSASTALPTAPDWWHLFSVEGQPRPAGAPIPGAQHTLVLGRYFRTLGIPLLAGRGFSPQETLGAANVVIVSASLARRFWPHSSALGHRICWGVPGPHATWLTIVGVAANVKQTGLDQPSGLETYAPYAQGCAARPGDSTCRNLYLAVRSQAAAVPPLRRLIATVDPAVPVTKIRSLRAVLSASIIPRRFNTLLLATFGLAALLLAAIGLYGVLAFAVTGRRRELAVRMALGAAPNSVARMVIGAGSRLALLGLAAGALATWLLARLLRARLGDLLYRTAAFDPLTWITVAAILLAVTLAAAYIPARRASRIPPLRTLRED
ncbi:MAG: ABC transporter permease, partial [Terriglobales bacterium]